MSPIAALGSAFCIGSADFLGGVSARRAAPVPVTIWLNTVALTILAVAVLVVRPALGGGQAVAAMAGGVVNAFSLNLIYAAFRIGEMSLAAPVIACGTALVPTAVSAVAGHSLDAPQLAGAALALLGMVLVTASRREVAGALRLDWQAWRPAIFAALAGGASFSILLLAAKGTPAGAIGVSALSRATSLMTCLLIATVIHQGLRLPKAARTTVAGGAISDAAGVTLLMVASSIGSTAVVAVLSSLYAVVTVLLAQIVLRERVSTRQLGGIIAALCGVILLSMG